MKSLGISEFNPTLRIKLPSIPGFTPNTLNLGNFLSSLGIFAICCGDSSQNLIKPFLVSLIDDPKQLGSPESGDEPG